MISPKKIHRRKRFFCSIFKQIIEERERKNAIVLYIIIYPLIISPPKNTLKIPEQ